MVVHASRPLKIATSLIFISITGFSGQARASIDENISVNEYTVDMKRNASLTVALLKSSPIRESGTPYYGQTKADIKWDFVWKEDGNDSCRISNIFVKLNVVTTLPKIDGGTTAQQKEFYRFLDALKAHEEKHVDIARQAQKDIEEQVKKLPPMYSCKLLEIRANSIANTIVLTQQTKQRAYDVDTSHGFAEDAWIDESHIEDVPSGEEDSGNNPMRMMRWVIVAGAVVGAGLIFKKTFSASSD